MIVGCVNELAYRVLEDVIGAKGRTRRPPATLWGDSCAVKRGAVETCLDQGQNGYLACRGLWIAGCGHRDFVF